MELRERWTRYLMKMECVICAEPLYHHETDARLAVDHILAANDFGPNPDITCLRDELTWFDHEGAYCDYHTHVMSKDD
jgi:hypothetical protein